MQDNIEEQPTDYQGNPALKPSAFQDNNQPEQPQLNLNSEALPEKKKRGGRRSTTWTKGNAHKIKPGFKHRKTIIKEQLMQYTGANWATFAGFLENEGAAIALMQLNKLSGSEYLRHYTSFIEYIKPKLIRSELNAGNQDITIRIKPTPGATIEGPQDIEHEPVTVVPASEQGNEASPPVTTNHEAITGSQQLNNEGRTAEGTDPPPPPTG